MSISEKSADAGVPAVTGESTNGGFGVHGICALGHGVHGDSISSRGVVGTSQTFHGVYGKSRGNVGVAGESDNMWGVLGICNHPEGIGVHGKNDKGDGVVGIGKRGVVGISNDYQGVFGKSVENAGVVGDSDKLHGIFGVCRNPNGGGVFGTNDTGFGVIGVSEQGIGISGKGGRLAGRFEGDVEVTGDIRLTNADCAEDFNICSDVTVEPGTVMVLGEKDTLFPSQRAYDKCVAGVISGAGDYKPGIVLDKQQSENNRQPIALLGKVYCKVDASYAPIEVGDLLTTSDTPGYAMKTIDPFKAFGAVIGKALRPLTEGQGLIPILIALQ